MADGDDVPSSAESTGLREEIFSDREASDIDETNTPSATRSSAVTRRLFTGESTARDNPLGDISNRSTLTKESYVASSAGGSAGTRRLSSAARDDPRTAQSNRSTSSDDTQLLILQEVKKANSCLNVFSDRLEALESRLASVENNQL